MSETNDHTIQLNRRAFVRNGSLFPLGASCSALFTAEELDRPKVRFGLVTDLHHADKPPLGSRFYRDTLTKLAEASGQFQKEKPDFVVELGDIIDAADSVETEQAYSMISIWENGTVQVSGFRKQATYNWKT